MGALLDPRFSSRLIMHYWKVRVVLVLFASYYPIESLASNFAQCFANVVNCAQNSTDPTCTSNLNISTSIAFSVLRTSNGSPIPPDPDHIQEATAISYDGCVQYCGSGQEPFSWNDFSQEYSAWLLPYLALLSQLPFGARRRTDNLMSAVLTLGSPTLAGYSIYLTLLNARWVNDRLFSDIHYPSTTVRRSVVRVLNSLQQVPLRVHPGEGARFESLIIHPDNDEWWTVFAEELEYSHTWSIASATSILWVIIAYLLTVAYSISNIFRAEKINFSGQGTGFGWLWLLPVVVGWLILSPKCDYKRVLDAYDKANRKVFVANPHDPVAAPSHVTSNFGITITPTPNWESHSNIISPDESRIPPVFSYARVWLWAQNVYVTFLFYRAASQKLNRRIGVDGQPIPESMGDDVPRESRLGTRDQVFQYCFPSDYERLGPRVLWPPGTFYRIVMASLAALQLQWGTTGAAVLVVWFTPTTGLGCRSLAYLIYGTLSTAVWFLMVLSSILGHYAHHLLDCPLTSDVESDGTLVPQPEITPASSVTAKGSIGGVSSTSITDFVAIPLCDIRAPQGHITNSDLNRPENILTHKRAHPTRLRRARTLSRLANWLRWLGKTLAVFNAIGTIANSLFQYAGVYDTCFCDSSKFTWGSRAFSVFAPSASDIASAESAWTGAFALALSCCAVFVGAIYLMRDSLPE